MTGFHLARLVRTDLVTAVLHSARVVRQATFEVMASILRLRHEECSQILSCRSLCDVEASRCPTGCQLAPEPEVPSRDVTRAGVTW